MKKSKNKKYLYMVYCFLVAFVFLLITSKNSFLYTFNDWVDANAFFTVGKSMFHGVVPYRDLFEQKGLLLYVIYGIGYLFSNTTFYGVFILEVLFFTVFLYYCHKIISLLLEEKYSFFILPLLTFIITTSPAFVHGGSAEEFCFPFFSISLYYYIKHFKKQNLTNKEFFINGIMAGIVFMIKYTMLGFWIGFMLLLGIDFLKEKKVLDYLKKCGYFLLGMLCPIALCFIYFLLTHSLKEFINCYFIVNIGSYASNQPSLLQRIASIYDFFFQKLTNCHILIKMMYLPFIIQLIRKRDYFHFSTLGIGVFTFLGIFWGLIGYPYYFLPMYALVLIPVIMTFALFSNYLKKLLEKQKLFCILTCFCFLIFTYFTYRNANYKDMILLPKENYFQYEFAEIINREDDKTLVNMGFLDCGLYTVANIVPSTYFFELQNLSYDRFPDNLDAFDDYIENKATEFIIFYGSYLEYIESQYPLLFQNYNLVAMDTYLFEGVEFQAYLFQRRNF